LTTTSAIIDLTIIDLLRKQLQHGDCANRHGLPVVTRRPLFRALVFYSQQPADRRHNTWHKRGVVESHSADAETNCPHQLPYHPLQVQIYVIVFSTSTRVMEMNYFPAHLTVGFKNGTFTCTFQPLNNSSVSMLDIYTQNGLLTHRIESSST
jgi:hypothetical protein